MVVYMQQPQGYSDGTNKVCLLHKAIYGLHQAARQFYLKLDEVLGEIGYRRLSADWAIWVSSSGAIIAAHVDDMTACGKEEQLMEAKEKIGKVLEVKDLGDITRYLNITCHYDFEGGRFLLSQTDYIIRLLDEYDMGNAFEVATPMVLSDKEKWEDNISDLLNDHNKRRYQALVGSLLYLMHATRPDLAYSIIRLSQYSAHPRSCHWEGLMRILRYLKRTKGAALVLGTPSNGNVIDSSQEILVGYFDAAHADTVNRRSTCEYFFLWNGSPISWCSRVQRTVALSTTEAEYMSGTEATKEAVWIRGLLSQICTDRPIKCVLRGDNQGSLALATNPIFHQRTKHIDIRQKFITEMVNTGIISVEYVSTQHMFADGLTKPLPKDTHWHHCKQMGLILALKTDKGILPPSSTSSKRKRRLSCDSCGNLFLNSDALQRHKLRD